MVRGLWMIEEETGFLQIQIIIDDGCQILNGITGMREKKTLQHIRLPLQNQFKPLLHHGADIGLQVGVGIAALQRRVPDLHRQQIHSPQDLFWILGGKHTKEVPTQVLLL